MKINVAFRIDCGILWDTSSSSLMSASYIISSPGKSPFSLTEPLLRHIMEQSISPDTFDLLMLKVSNAGKATYEFNSVIITIELIS